MRIFAPSTKENTYERSAYQCLDHVATAIIIMVAFDAWPKKPAQFVLIAFLTIIFAGAQEILGHIRGRQLDHILGRSREQDSDDEDPGD
jgi:hypothetical protein